MISGIEFRFFYVLVLLVNKKSSLVGTLCELLNGIGNLADNIDWLDTGETINGAGRKHGGGKTKTGGSKCRMVLQLKTRKNIHLFWIYLLDLSY